MRHYRLVYLNFTDWSQAASATHQTAPRNFYSGMPDIIRQNVGNGYWVDMWVICDSANCYLFSPLWASSARATSTRP
jgi:hypothetical protein